MILLQFWDVLGVIVAILLILLLLLVLAPYLPSPHFETLVGVIGKIPYINFAVVFIGPLQKRYASKLAKDVNVKTDADISVSHHLQSNPGHVKPVSTLRVQFEIESRSPVNVRPAGAQINVAFVSQGIPFKTLYWNPDISPKPPTGFEVQTIPAKKDGRFVIEFLPPIFLYYTSQNRQRIGRTLYFDGWVSVETGFGAIPIELHAEAPLSEEQVKHDFHRVRGDFEEGFDFWQQPSSSEQ